MAHIVIINPRFEDSFWGMESCMSILGKRANLPVACLPLLAALTPNKHQVTLIDENVEVINFDVVAQADIVCVTGMYIQRVRMEEILQEAKRLGRFTVVGGPHITVLENYWDDELVDVKFLGEADETWPKFLQAWEQGTHKNRYTQPAKTDMTTLPPPRLDLLKNQHYMFGSMQISRGCPYQCEFCDIIITFGRRPRLKCSHQVIKELQAFVDAGFQILFIVDDNLIGNKKEIKPILRDIIAWQQERNYPLILFTEASLDLAEDDELMELMGEAGFQSVFVGIESINEESLKETKKYQNVRPKAGTILDRIQRILDSGIDVWCGMILGFDHDDPSVFETMPAFLKQTRITNALIGLLHAIPTTPLFARLMEEGRVDMEGIEEWATNVIPLLMSREQLRQGFVKVMQDVYDTDSYFERVDGLFIEDNFTHKASKLPFWKKHRWSWFKRCAKNYLRFAVLFRRLTRDVPEAHLRKRYRQQLLKIVRARGFEPHILFAYALKVTMHYHFYNTVERMAKEFTAVANVR